MTLIFLEGQRRKNVAPQFCGNSAVAFISRKFRERESGGRERRKREREESTF